MPVAARTRRERAVSKDAPYMAAARRSALALSANGKTKLRTREESAFAAG
jgi:hypothetical protein